MANLSPRDIKVSIQAALGNFAALPLPAATRNLFSVLGYTSPRNESILRIATVDDFFRWLAGAGKLDLLSAKDQNDLRAGMPALHFLFQLTDDEIKAAIGPAQASLFDSGTAVDGSQMHSYLVFAAEIAADAPGTRSNLVRLVRLINKPLPMPALILFRRDDNLTLAAIDRRQNKATPDRDVLEKVTLIKDISVTKPHRAHIEILHDLALQNLTDVTSFIGLHHAWRKVLDTTGLNKRFYSEIANWYFWAIKEVLFPLPPTNKLAADLTNNAINMIRLLTRLIFVWFLKEKGLAPDKLFDPRKLQAILQSEMPDANGEKDSSTYYHAILQNLFFATLNTEMNRDKPGSRRFVKNEEGGALHQKNEYGIKNLYRYGKHFALSQEDAVALFDEIPFLNGGLFDCLDKEDDRGRVMYVDGFTRNPKLRPVAPDYLFFSDYRIVDLSGDYGDAKKKHEKVRGLISILQDYKFTIAENTPVEEEVALDPELLGNVFENLLASYNPETGVTARKQTGSFYTPRMIVNHMVDGALATYLLQQLSEKSDDTLQPERQGAKRDRNRARFAALIAYNDLPNPFSSAETTILIEAIQNLRALDPAVGSGAFPMGLLHKMVYLLHKLDPDNAAWKRAQVEAAGRITDPAIRHDLLCHIEEVFDPATNQADYGRKLFLIQKCIYGVDIQPIAVQIAKLRFFISLVADQKVNENKKNRGVMSLPNLETRFVAANTLLGIDRPPIDDLFGGPIRAKEAELRSVRSRHFDARNRAEKLRCMAEDKRIRGEIVNLLEKDNYSHEKAVRLSDWNPYDQNKSADFFDAEWMFGITEGFDITIGNPPYVRADAGEEHLALRQQILASRRFVTLWEKWDLFIPFIELGYQVLKPNGVTTMIVSDAYCHAKYAQKSQEWFLRNSRILRLDFLSKIKVFDAGVHNIVYFFQKANGADNRPERLVHEEEFGNITTLPTDEQKNLSIRVFFPDAPEQSKLDGMIIPLAEILYISYGLRPSSDENDAKGEFTTSDLVAETEDAIHCRPFVEGKHLGIWLPATNLWLEWGTMRAPAKFCRPTFPQMYDVKEKILAQRSPGPDPKACYDSNQLIFSPSSVGFILWHGLAGIRNKSLKKRARYKGEKPSRPDLPKREELEKTSRRFAVKYLLAVMNSTVARNFLRANRRSNIHLYPDDWKKLPIPDVPPEKQAPIVALVDKILAAKGTDPRTDISTIEQEIDELVNQLYGLSSYNDKDSQLERNN